MIRSVCAWIAVVGIGAPLWAKDINPDPKSLDVPAEIDRKARELTEA